MTEFCHSPTSGGAGGLRRTANFLRRRRRNTSEDEPEQSVFMWDLLVFRFLSEDLPLFELGGCFVYWKKMVSWLLWPIKAVL